MDFSRKADELLVRFMLITNTVGTPDPRNKLFHRESTRNK